MNKLLFKTLNLYWLPLLSGLLLFLSFPKIDFYLFAFAGLVPLLYFLYGKDLKTAFKGGFVFGLVYFFGTTYWIYHSINKYGSIPFVPSLLLVLLLCLYLSLYTGLFSVLYSAYIRKSNLPVLIVAPVLWTSLEFLRSYALSGFPWSSLGYSQYKFLPFIQIADITGIYGISFLIVALNGAIADVLLFKQRRLERPLYSLIPTISGFVLLAFVLLTTFIYGFYRIYQERNGHMIKIAIIQGNIEQDKKWEPAYQQAVLSTYKDLSLIAAKESPDMIVWPETALPFLFKNDKNMTDNLIAFQQQLGSYLLFGSVMTHAKSLEQKLKSSSQELATEYTNSAILLNRTGNISYVYDKIHLVPFGEYVPLRHLLFFVDKLVYGIGDYIPGDSYIKAVTPFGSFGTLICYEIIFPGLARKFFTKDGDFIVTITNDAWFGNTFGPHQHFSMAVLRAIENRKPVVRAANSGISGFIDSSGRIVQKTPLFERTFSIMDIKTDNTLSVYTKYGDIFSYFCIVFTMLFIIKITKMN